MFCYHLRCKMQKSILIEAGSNKIYLYAKRQLLKWVEPIYARKKMCMLYPPTWLLQAHPFESFQEACRMYSISYFDQSILLKFLHQHLLLSWCNFFFLLLSALAHCVPPSCANLIASSVSSYVNIVNLAHSFLISCKCSVLPPVVFLFL